MQHNLNCHPIHFPKALSIPYSFLSTEFIHEIFKLSTKRTDYFSN